MKLHLGHLLGLTAIAIAACAAYFSVYGISKLFAGATLAVIVMASVLEFGKLVAASFLQRQWRVMNGIMRVLFTTIIIGLMIITSAGIFGFLSSAYQKTYQKYSVLENELKYAKQKEMRFSADVAQYDKELDRINGNIFNLNNKNSITIQVPDSTSSTGFRNTVSTFDSRNAKARIPIEEANKKVVQGQRDVANDSLKKYASQILLMETNTEVTEELGPLIHIKEATGWPMNKVVNVFIGLLIFVFDPMAILMILAANSIFENRRLEKLAMNPIVETKEDAEVFFEAVTKESEPNEKLKEAAKDYKERIFESPGMGPNPRFDGSYQPSLDESALGLKATEPEVIEEPEVVVPDPLEGYDGGFSTNIELPEEPEVVVPEIIEEPKPIPNLATSRVIERPVPPSVAEAEAVARALRNADRKFTKKIPPRRNG